MPMLPGPGGMHAPLCCHGDTLLVSDIAHVLTDTKTKACRRLQMHVAFELKSVLHTQGSLMMGTPESRPGSHTEACKTGWRGRDSTRVSSQPSHTRRLSSPSADGLLND